MLGRQFGYEGSRENSSTFCDEQCGVAGFSEPGEERNAPSGELQSSNTRDQGNRVEAEQRLFRADDGSDLILTVANELDRQIEEDDKEEEVSQDKSDETAMDSTDG